MEYKRNSTAPLIIFFFLTFFIAWPLMGLAVAQNRGWLSLPFPVEPFMVLGSWIPNIAAFIVVAWVIKQKNGFRNLIRGWGKFKFPVFWYAITLIPVVLSLLTILIYGITYGYYPLTDIFSDPLALLSILVLITITGALGEELGWRGFALPWLQTRMNALWASLLLGVIWVIWHTPLWFAGLGFEQIPFWAYFVTGVSFSVLITWACNNARGSIVIASLFHLTLNFAVNMFESFAMPLFAVLMAFAAVVIIWQYGPKKLSRKNSLPIDYQKNTWINT